jgi:hypothetical protein
MVRAILGRVVRGCKAFFGRFWGELTARSDIMPNCVVRFTHSTNLKNLENA